MKKSIIITLFSLFAICGFSQTKTKVELFAVNSSKSFIMVDTTLDQAYKSYNNGTNCATSYLLVPSTQMNFITLSSDVQTGSIIQNADGTLSGLTFAWYGVQGCPYDAFKQQATIKFKTGVNPRASDIQQVANDSADAYRKRVYPNIK